MFKKYIAQFLVITMVLTAAVVPRPAHAIIGAIAAGTGSVPVAIPVLVLGGLLAVPSTYGLVDATRPCHSSGLGCFGDAIVKTFEIIFSSLGLVVSGILLDESQPGRVQFAHLADNEAVQIGLSTMERDHFNDEVEEINAVYQTVVTDLQAMPGATVQDSKALWQQYRDVLSPEAYSAVGKVVSSAVAAHQ